MKLLRGRRRLWLFALIVLLLILAYSALGFLLAPRLIRGQLLAFADETLHRKARVERVSLDPYSFTVSVHGFALNELDDTPLVSFDEFFVDLEPAALLRRTWTFTEIRLVNPAVSLVRFADGGSNIARLLDDLATDEEAAPPAVEAEGAADALRLLMRRVVLQGGSADVKDQSLATPFETRLGPLDLEVRDLSTLPDREGNHTVDVALEDGSRLRWTGTFSTNPLRSAGHLSFKGERLRLLWRYIRDQVRFEVAEGTTLVEADYTASIESGKAQLAVSDLSASLKGLSIREKGEATEVISVPEISLKGGQLEYPSLDTRVKELRVRGARLVTWRDREVPLNLAVLLAPDATTDPPADGGSTSGAPAWSFGLERLAVEDFGAAFEDRSVSPPFTSGVEKLRLEVRDLSLDPGSRASAEWETEIATGGKISGSGSFGIDPPVFEGAVKIEKLSLPPVQPYFGDVANLELESGELGIDLQVASVPEETLRATGQVEVADLATKDTLLNERFLAWKRLALRDVLFELSARKFETPEVSLEALYGRIAIAKDGTTNVANVLAPPKESPAAAEPVTPTATESKPFAVSIGRVSVRDSSANFTDLSLPLPFAAGIHNLRGSVSKITSSPGTVSKISLKGVVEKYGSCAVNGNLNLFAPDRNADVAVEFENVEMQKLSPYTVKFAGYEIDSGKLSLDLGYRISERKLKAKNKIVVDQLELGREVESPGATDLPLRLAIAMLKDSDGRISVKVPVQGSLDDPKFSYGKALRRALRDLIVNTATAPFNMLAEMVGAGGKKLDSVWFDPAGAELSPPQREKLEKLAQAMQERPKLVLTVRGRWDPKLDPAALGARKVEMQVAERLGLEATADGELPFLPADERRDALEDLYKKEFSRTELRNIEAVNTRSALEGETEAVLDEEAYLDALVSGLAKPQEVPEQDLIAVADARARTIKEFLAAAGVDGERIRLLDGRANDEARKKRIPVKLKLRAG